MDTATNIQRRAGQIVELGAALEQEAQQHRWGSAATIAKDLIILNFGVVALVASIDPQLAESAFKATRDEITQTATDLGVLEQFQGPVGEDAGDKPQQEQEPERPVGGETSDQPTL